MKALLAASAAPLVFLALLPTGLAAQASAASASVLVQVSNESGDPVAGEMVVLQINDGQEIIDEIVATSEDDGAVLFQEVPTADGYLAVPFVVYNGYTYRGEEMTLVPEGNAAILITVYTATEGGADLHIEILHVVLTAVEPGVYQAVQVMQVLNVNEQAFFGGPEFEGQRSGLTIPFPPGAVSVAPLPDISGLDPSRLAVDGNRLLDLRALPPGSHQVAISYDLATGPDGKDIELMLPYPTAEVSILLGPDIDAAKIDSDDLLEQTAQEIPGQGVYANWTSGVVDAGKAVTFHLGPRSVPISAEAWSLLGLAVALLVTTAASIFGARLPQPDLGSRDELIAAVASLDDAHDRAAVSESGYYTRRRETLERILELDQRASAPQAHRVQ